MKTLQRENWILLAVLAGMILVALIGIYVPQHIELKRLDSQVDVQKKALQSNLQKVAAVPQMVRQVHKMRGGDRSLVRRLPEQKELAAFLGEITGNLSREQLSSQLIESPTKAIRDEKYNTLPIAMKLRGSYMSLASFLKRIDQMERMARVQRLLITPDPKSSNVNVELCMNIYFTAG